MNRVVQAIILTGVVFVSPQAHADDSASQSTTSRAQIIAQLVDCMRKRISADKSRSYNEAMKACKGQANRASDDSPSGALVASDTQPKR